MILTKQQAIEEHRKMWTWIIERLENGDIYTNDISKLKNIYIDTYTKNKELNRLLWMNTCCYCCVYAEQINPNYFESKCKMCPLCWGKNGSTCMLNFDVHGCGWKEGLYDKLTKPYLGINDKIEISKQILNLPERPDNENDIFE